MGLRCSTCANSETRWWLRRAHPSTRRRSRAPPSKRASPSQRESLSACFYAAAVVTCTFPDSPTLCADRFLVHILSVSPSPTTASTLTPSPPPPTPSSISRISFTSFSTSVSLSSLQTNNPLSQVRVIERGGVPQLPPSVRPPAGHQGGRPRQDRPWRAR